MAKWIPQSPRDGESEDDYFETAHLKEDLRARTARGGALSLGAQGARFLLHTIRTVALAWLLVPEDYGLIAMVTAVTSVLGMFKDLGLSMATIMREKINHDQVSTLFWINVSLSSVLVILAIAIAPVLSWFYAEPRLTRITLALAPIFLLSGLTVQHQALLRRQMRFGSLILIRLISHASGISLGIVMAYFGARYWALVAITAAIPTIQAAGVWITCAWRPGRPVRGSGVWPMIRFGGNLTGASLLRSLSTIPETMLLGWAWGSVALGLYAKAYQLLLLPIRQVNTAIGAVAVPTLSRLQDTPRGYQQAYLGILEKLVLITMPGSVFLIGTAPWLIPAVLGPNWVDAARIFSILGFAGLVQPILASTGWLFITQDRTGDLLRWSAVDFSIRASFVIVGLSWGAMGVATAVAVAHFVEAPILFWYVSRAASVHASDIYRAIAAPAIASAGALLAIFALGRYAKDLQPFILLALSGVITVMVVLAILAMLPTGRAALVDLRSTFKLIVKRRIS